MERLLVDRVVACRLHLHHLEALYAGKDSMSLELSSYYQRSISAAQRRYLGAIKALALVCKVAVPVLQVNIACKQVNVAGALPPGSPDAVTSPDGKLGRGPLTAHGSRGSLPRRPPPARSAGAGSSSVQPSGRA